MKHFMGIFFALIVCCCPICGCNSVQGELFSLQEAFEEGFLTKTDLEEIAYYHNRGEEFPYLLAEKDALAIRKTVAGTVKEPDADEKGVEIVRYYGEYNGCFAVITEDIYHEHPAVIVEEYQKTVGGVVLVYGGFHEIVIWKAAKI